MINATETRALNDRECYMILKGPIAALAAAPGMNPDVVRGLLDLWAEQDAPWLPIRDQVDVGRGKAFHEIAGMLDTSLSIRGEELSLAATVALHALMGVISGLRTIAGEEEVRRAVAYLHENDDVLEAR